MYFTLYLAQMLSAVLWALNLQESVDTIFEQHTSKCLDTERIGEGCQAARTKCENIYIYFVEEKQIPQSKKVS